MVLTEIYMIVFVLHGPYTDRAYAYMNSTTVTTWHWLWETCQAGTVCPGVELEYDRCLGCENSCLFQHEQSGITLDEIFRRGDLLVHDDILVNHFPMKVKIKTVLALSVAARRKYNNN
jgi:hypothetical protein